MERSGQAIDLPGTRRRVGQDHRIAVRLRLVILRRLHADYDVAQFLPTGEAVFHRESKLDFAQRNVGRGDLLVARIAKVGHVAQHLACLAVAFPAGFLKGFSLVLEMVKIRLGG
jgi:hypothetical protein